MRRILTAGVVAALALFAPGLAGAQTPTTPAPQLQPAGPSFSIWLASFRAEAMARGIRVSTLDSAFVNVQPIPRIIELDHKQPEFTLTFAEYMSRVVGQPRITRGKALMAHHRKLLAAVSRKYGVPPQVIVAMWGIESDFGRLTGTYGVVPALATLAYDGRRSQYFRTELMNALTMIDKGSAKPAEMRGSWAGAMGQCQFMPSTYLKYAVDWDGNGHPDIWASQADVFASTANFLSGLGWNPHHTWGRKVTLPSHGVAPVLVGLDSRRSLNEWNRLGLRDEHGKALPKSEIEASLIFAEPDKAGQAGSPYLVYDNFRVFMKWNRSTFFALAAGTLADRLASK